MFPSHDPGGGDFTIAEEDQAYTDITSHTNEPE
jgi:hypothetical protein